MEIDIQEKMLDALEVFHYEAKFKEQLFVVVFHETEDFGRLLADLRVLAASNVKIVAVSEDGQELRELCEKWRRCGFPFEVQPEDARVSDIRIALRKGILPVVPYLAAPDCTEASCWCALASRALKLASGLKAAKIFFLSNAGGLIADEVFYSAPSPEELEKILSEARTLNYPRAQLRMLRDWQNKSGGDVVLLQASEGNLFKEIFTLLGAGTLLSRNYQNDFRAARESDVCDITLIMQPYVRNATILPIDEDDVLASIGQFYVYTVDQQIVAAARLHDYGERCELGKLCTLPRYRGQGRAKQLITKLVEIARAMGKRSIFAVTINKTAAALFKSIGFAPVERETLPEEWRKGYDFTRPSMAFELPLVPTPIRMS